MMLGECLERARSNRPSVDGWEVSLHQKPHAAAPAASLASSLHILTRVAAGHQCSKARSGGTARDAPS